MVFVNPLNRFLRPLQGDQSHAVEIILFTLMGASLLLLIAPFLVPDYTARWLLIIGAVNALALPLVVLNRLGHARLASVLLVTGFWMVLTLAAVTGGGIASYAALHYLVVILIAAHLFGFRAGLFAAVVCGLTGMGFVILEMTGNLTWSAVPHTPLTRWIALIVLISIVMGLHYLDSKTTAEALRQTRQELGERNRAENALRISEEKYRSLIEQAPDAILIADAKLRLVDINSRACELSGYTRAEVLQMTLLDFVPPGSEADFEQRMQSLKKGSTGAVERTMLRKDGTILPIEVSTKILSDGRLQSIIRDITERKHAETLLRESESRWRTIFYESAIGVALIDESGRAFSTNPALQRMLGYSETELSKMVFADFTHPDDVACTPNLFEDMVKGARDSFQLEKRYLHKAGHIVWVNLRVSIIRDQQGQFIFAIDMAEDISERKQAEEQNRKLLHRLGERVKELTALHGASRVLQHQDLDLPEVLEKLVALLPPAFQYPTITTARIVLDEISKESPDFAPHEQLLRTDFITDDARQGSIEVTYTENRPVEVEGPFLAEERALIDTLADMLKANYDRRQAELNRQVSERRFRELLENVELVAILLDTDGRVIFCNDYLLKLTGYQQSDLLGADWFARFVPENRPDVRQLFLEGLRTGSLVKHFENPILTRNGELRTIAWNNTLLRKPSGEMIGTASIGEDITDRKRNEVLLNGQKQVLEMMAMGAPLDETLNTLISVIEAQSAGMLCSILVLDADGERLRHAAAPNLPPTLIAALDDERIGPNAGSCGTAAFTRETVIVEDVLTDPLWQNYRHLAEQHKFRACWSTPIISAQQAVLGTFDAYFPKPIAPNEHHERLLAIARHTAAVCISRKREEDALLASEERYRTLFETAPNSVRVFDEGLRLIMANQQAVKLFGYDRTSEIIGMAARDFVAPEDWERGREIVQQVLETGRMVVYETTGLRKDGSSFALESRLTKIVGEQGKPQAFLSVSTDITERKQAELALKTSAEQLRALSARIHSAREEEGTRIAREIHDELGGAMTGLKWDLEALDRSLTKGRPPNGSGRLRERIAGMTALIEGTIDIVRRISSDLRPGVLDDLGLPAAIDWQATQFQSRTGISYHADSTLETVKLSRSGATAVFRIFQEILTNVLRHAQAKNIFVGLEEHDNFLDLRVRDDGRGITEGEKSNRHSLGLLGMRERALLVGGEVSIIGDHLKGTTIHVRVPLDG